MSKDEFREKLESILKKFETVAVKGIEYATTVAKGLTMYYKDGVDKLLSEGLKVKEELEKSSLDEKKKKMFRDLLSDINAFKETIDEYSPSGIELQRLETRLKHVPNKINVIRWCASSEKDWDLSIKQILELHKYVDSVLNDYDKLVSGYLLNVISHIKYLQGVVDYTIHKGLDLEYLNEVKKAIKPDIWNEYLAKVTIESPTNYLQEIKDDIMNLVDKLNLNLKDERGPAL